MERLIRLCKSGGGAAALVIFQKVSAKVPSNPLGLDTSQGPLVFCLLSITWNNAEDDSLVYRVADALIEKIDEVNIAAGLFNRCKALNYAAGSQNPTGSYGRRSVESFRKVSGKYDPEVFFQTRVPGGFKLPK